MEGHRCIRKVLIAEPTSRLAHFPLAIRFTPNATRLIAGFNFKKTAPEVVNPRVIDTSLWLVNAATFSRKFDSCARNGVEVQVLSSAPRKSTDSRSLAGAGSSDRRFRTTRTNSRPISGSCDSNRSTGRSAHLSRKQERGQMGPQKGFDMSLLCGPKTPSSSATHIRNSGMLASIDSEVDTTLL